MTWSIDFSKQALKFIEKHKLKTNLIDEIKNFLRKTQGENVNIDVKRLKGDWQGYLRIRKGKMRIIFSVDENKKIIYIDKVDFRGDVYK